MAHLDPFFKGRPQLCGMIAIAHGLAPNKIARQYDVFGDFKADFVLGDSERSTFLFIELEGASAGSLFQKTNRETTVWGPGISAGFYQIIDWFWKLNDQSSTKDFEERFGNRNANISGIIIVGRSQDIEERDRRRLVWMNGKVRVDSREVIVYTYDDLLTLLEDKLKFFELGNTKD